MTIPHKFYYVEVDPQFPVAPLAIDMQIDEKSGHVRWYNMERWHDIDFVKKVQVDDKTVQIVTSNKVFTFKDLDLALYNEKLKQKIKQEFSSENELREYLSNKLTSFT